MSDKEQDVSIAKEMLKWRPKAPFDDNEITPNLDVHADDGKDVD